MKKQLFKKASMEEIKQSSTAGSRLVNAKYSYINGYYESAKSLIDNLIKEEYTGKKDTFFYPICFNYRHYIELHLKSLIEESEILYDRMEKLGYLKNGNLTEKKSDSLDTTHNLSCLIEILEERIHYTSISNEQFPKDIKKYIKQMNDNDLNGQKYRYYKNKNGKLHFPKEERYDMKNLSKIMEEVNNMLWAIDSHIDHYIEMSNDIISEYESANEPY